MAEKYQDGDFDDALQIDWWTMDVPRFAKMILIGPVVTTQPGGLWLGAGLGHLKNGKTMKPTAFAKEYNWLLRGTVTWLMFVFVGLGFVGVAWNFAVMGYIFFSGGKLSDQGRKMFVFLLFLAMFTLIYNDSFRVPAVCLMFAYFALVIRRGAVSPCPETCG